MNVMTKPEAATAVGGITVPLTTPVEGREGRITEVRFREPVLGDWVACGEFQTHSFIGEPMGDGKVEVIVNIDPAAVAKWFQRLSGLEMAVLTRVTYEDGKRLYKALNTLVGAVHSGNFA